MPITSLMSLQTLNYANQPDTISPGREAKKREDLHWSYGIGLTFVALMATFTAMKVTMAYPRWTTRWGACLAMAELGLVLAAIVWNSSHHRRSQGSWSFTRGAFIGGILALTVLLISKNFVRYFF